MKFDISETLLGSIGTALSAAGWLAQANEILELVSLGLTIVGALITFIILPVLNWYKHAKEDGEIDADEVSDLVDDIKDGIEKTKDTIADATKDEDEKDD